MLIIFLHAIEYRASLSPASEVLFPCGFGAAESFMYFFTLQSLPSNTDICYMYRNASYQGTLSETIHPHTVRPSFATRHRLILWISRYSRLNVQSHTLCLLSFNSNFSLEYLASVHTIYSNTCYTHHNLPYSACILRKYLLILREAQLESPIIRGSLYSQLILG